MMASHWRRRAIRWGVGLFVLAVFVLGMREVILSSTFQLFGDYVATIDTTEKVVALTFDDGPHPQNTLKVLDILDRYHVRATFFMMGVNVERFPAVAREVLARGHEAGNHSYSHPKLIWMWPASVREEIERTDALLRGVGVTGEILFRPPHAAKFLVLPWVLNDLHKTSVLGDVDPEEWKRPPAETIAKSVMDQTGPGSIVTLHDPSGIETLRALETVLPQLLAQGYRIETAGEFIRRRR